MIHIILNLVLIGLVACEPLNKNNPSKNEWFIQFYTGSKIWAGTDSKVFVELQGQDGNSPIMEIKSSRFQMEANSVDVYSLGDLEGKQVGSLVSIVVGKQHSYSFFNDWQLSRAVVIDPFGKKYIFVCECWLTTFRPQRLINLTRTDYIESSLSNSDNKLGVRSSAAFPATIGILFMLLLLIIFTYFSNEICKKWREHIIHLSHSSRNRPDNDNGAVTLSPRQDRTRSIYRNVEETNLTSIPLNTTINFNSTIEDKPPEYKDLFPGEVRVNVNVENENREASLKNTSV